MNYISRAIHALLLLLYLSGVICFADSANKPEDIKPKKSTAFKLFDGTLYSGKPDLSPYGIQPIKIIYHRELWHEGQDDSKLPDPLRVKDSVRHLNAPNSIAVIDIEHWPVTQTDGRFNAENLDKHLQVISLFRKFSPSTAIGFYGIPIPDYWRAIDGNGKLESPLWMAENDRLAPIVDAEDAVFPSLYTFYADREQWRKYAIAQITEARRLAKNKLVYVFLWPQYHNSSPLLGLDYIAADYWKLELETVRQYADGIVIWGGSDQKWDDSAEWWQVTKDFIKTIK